MIFSVLTSIVGFAAGVTFYAWWVHPDMKNQQRRIAELDDQRERLSQELLRVAKFSTTVTRNGKTYKSND